MPISKYCPPQWRGETRAETARRKKKAIRASAVENRSTALRGLSAAGRSAVVKFPHFSLFFLYNTYVY